MKILTNKELQITDEQKNVIEKTDGVVCLTAGAGSGKTFVIVNRYFNILKKLINNGKSLEEALKSILTVTFTNKAAHEMKERISKKFAQEFGDDFDTEKYINNVLVSTIDSWALNFIKSNFITLGIDPDFKMIDPVFSRLNFLNLALSYMKDYYYTHFGISKSLNDFLHSIYKFISSLKGMLITPNIFKDLISEQEMENKNTKEIAKIILDLYEKYEEWLSINNSYDFGNLLIKSYNAIQENENIRQELQKQIKYLLVDEYQDITCAQDKLLCSIIGLDNDLNKNYFIVGDVGQSIYGFRNADYKNMLGYVTNKEISNMALTINFRSTKRIIDFINLLFVKDNAYFQKLRPDDLSKEGRKIELIIKENPKDEAASIVRKIKQLINEGYKYKDIRILFRSMTNANLYFREAFEKHKIPFKIVGTGDLASRDEIKDFIASFTLALNLKNDKAVLRLLMSDVFKFSNKDLIYIKNILNKEKQESLYDLLKSLKEKDCVLQDRINNFINFTQKLFKLKYKKNIQELFDFILKETGYIYLIRTFDDVRYNKAILGIELFKKIIHEYMRENFSPSISSFLDYTKELINFGAISKDADTTNVDEIIMMSIHQAKGLQFPVTIISNVSKSSFPGKSRQEDFHLDKGKGFIVKYNKDKNSLYNTYLKDMLDNQFREEEERLFYTALTRAQDRLVISGHGRKSLSDFLLQIVSKEESTYIIKDKYIDHVSFAKFTENSNETIENTEHKKQIFEKIDLIDIEKTLYKPGKIETQENHFYSVSSLKDYENCPRLYYFKHELGLPIDNKTNFDIQKGNLAHKFYEEFFSHFNKNKIKTEKDIEENFKCLSDLMNINKDINREYKTLIKNLKNSKIYNKPLMLEKNFSWHIGTAFIRGTIDRIDYIDGKYRIIDYKTGASKHKERYKLPMNIYKEAAQDLFNIKIDKMYLYYPLDGDGKLIEVASIEDTKEKIKSTVENIKEEKFENTCNKIDCQKCNYNSFCDL